MLPQIPLTTNRNKLKQRDTGFLEYRRNIRAGVYGLWSGRFNFAQFVFHMVAAIERGFRRAWYDGAAECGISPIELTNLELDRLRLETNTEISYVIPFADDIDATDKASGNLLRPLQNRAELWANRYEAIKSMARSYACKDQKLEWVWNPLKEHCTDCGRLNGRVYRASIWRKYNLEPRMKTLACRGYNCGCEFRVTTNPVTPGRPPKVP
jgi:hypothetical protein